MELGITPAELARMSVAEVQDLRSAWMDRETRAEDLACRQAMFIAAKVWDSKGEIEPRELFPLLDPAARMTPEERDRRSWEQVKTIFRTLAKGQDGKDLYAIHRGHPG